MNRRRLLEHAGTCALAWMMFLTPVCVAGAELEFHQAGTVVRESGVQGGLVVHLGCGDGTVGSIVLLVKTKKKLPVE